MSFVGAVIDGVHGTGRSPRSKAKLRDDYGIRLSADSLARYIHHYQVMLAARQEDPEALRRNPDTLPFFRISKTRSTCGTRSAKTDCSAHGLHVHIARMEIQAGLGMKPDQR